MATHELKVTGMHGSPIAMTGIVFLSDQEALLAHRVSSTLESANPAHADEDRAMARFTDAGGPLAIGLDERRVLGRVLSAALVQGDADDSTRAAHAELLTKVSVEQEGA